MAKVYGLTGKANGKYGNAVFRIRYGQQIMSQYNPVVANPRTAAQVEVRAKLKLMSQLSASFASVIAIPRQGAMTPRNLFTKYNYPFVTYDSSSDPGVTSVQLSSIQLTRSAVTLPELQVSGEGPTYTLSLANADADIDRVVYCAFSVQTDKTLRLGLSIVSTDSPMFSAELPINPSLKYIVYAYGIRLNSHKAKAVFSQTEISSATVIASLMASRQLTQEDITLTETKFVEVNP